LVGGTPAGTTIVGSFPLVPAGDRSAAGIEAIVAAGAVVDGLLAAVVVGLDEELLHPANPRKEAPITTSDHVRAESMKEIPFRS
jgi:hypothetical protein